MFSYAHGNVLNGLGRSDSFEYRYPSQVHTIPNISVPSKYIQSSVIGTRKQEHSYANDGDRQCDDGQELV